MNRCQFSTGVHQFSPRSAASRYFPSHMDTNPSGARSGCKNLRGVPFERRTASAARYPLRTAPSIVAGQPVSVQSPARNNPRTEDSCFGRQRSTPGSAENVAAASFMTVAFTNSASRAAGSACRTSSKHRSIISWRDLCSKSYDALITSCRYCPPSVLFALPFVSPYNSVLLKIHCVVVSISVMNGSVITWWSNQKCTPVIGETFILSKFASDGSLCFTLSGNNSASAVCGTAKTYAPAVSSFPSSKRTAAISPLSIFKPRTGAIQFFIERAHQHHAPESFDCAFCLSAPVQPLQHGDAAIFLEVLGPPFGAQDFQHGASDGQLVPQSERSKSSEGTRHMKRRRKNAGLYFATAALRIEKKEPVEKLDFVRGADALVKIREIRAAAERHVLAIVHVLAVRQHVGRCAAAEEGTLFEQAHAPAGFSQRDAGCQSRQPAADHDHAFQEYSLPCGARNAPWR